MFDRLAYLEDLLGMVGTALSKQDPALAAQLRTYFEGKNNTFTRDGTYQPQTDDYYKFKALAEKLGVKL